MTTLATITDDTGFETCYVSFADIIALDGALTETPVVKSQTQSVFKTSNVSLNSTEVIYNNVTHVANQLLEFRVTGVAGSNKARGEVEITYKTAKRDGKLCYRIDKEVC